jgi:hypothetical protein
MKKIALFVTAICGSLLVAGPVMAMEPYMPRSPKVFAKLDSNADGKITAAELQPRAAKRFDRLDQNSNGEVTAAEIDTAFQKVIAQRRDRILRRMVKDANGIVTRAELDAFVVFMMDSADSNHDGGVSLDEAQRFRLAKVAR